MPIASLAEVLATVERKLAGSERPLPLPFPALNVLMGGGIVPGEVMYVGAWPGVGKTVFLVETALHVARHGTPCMIVSREMPPWVVARRMLAREGKIDNRRLRQNDVPSWDALRVIVGHLAQLPIQFAVSASTVPAVYTEVAEAKPRLVLIDYLQILEGDGQSGRARVEGISRGLKKMAMDLDVAVVCLSSLARNTDPKPRAPRLDDLRESGSLEHDADWVVLLHRPEGSATATAHLAKGRDGETGVVALQFEGRFQRLTEAPPVVRRRPRSDDA